MGQSLLGGSPMMKGRVAGSLPHPNDLALIPILLPIALGLFAREHNPFVRLLVSSSFPLAVLSIILSQSRNAWLGLALGLGVLLALGRNHRLVVALIGLSGAFFLIAYVLNIGSVPHRVQVLLGAPGEHRASLWLVAWEMFKESPLLGKGLHTFGEFYHPYLSRVALPEGVVPELGPVPWAHNLFLEIAAERGVFGLIGFLVPAVAMAVVLFQSSREPASQETRAMALGLGTSLLVFVGMAQFDLTFLKDWVLLVYWLLAAMIARLPALAGPSSGAGLAEAGR